MTTEQAKQRTQHRIIHAQVAAVTKHLLLNGKLTGDVYEFHEFHSDASIADIVNKTVTQQSNGDPLTRILSADDVATMRRDNLGMTKAELTKASRASQSPGSRLEQLEDRVDKLAAEVRRLSAELRDSKRPQLSMDGIVRSNLSKTS